jgi:hypothetical protein
MLVDI